MIMWSKFFQVRELAKRDSEPRSVEVLIVSFLWLTNNNKVECWTTGIGVLILIKILLSLSHNLIYLVIDEEILIIWLWMIHSDQLMENVTQRHAYAMMIDWILEIRPKSCLCRKMSIEWSHYPLLSLFAWCVYNRYENKIMHDEIMNAYF